MPQSQSSLAVVLRARPYGEVDKITTFLTRDFGKLTGIAKGAKNSRRRFPNCLEPMARVRVHFRTRAGAGLAFLERCDLIQSAQDLASPNRFAYGSYLLELVDRLTHEDDPITEIYDLLTSALGAIEVGPATSALLRSFELQLLRDLGYGPPLHGCGRCQQPFESAAHCFYDGIHGELLCAACGAGRAAADRFDSPTFAALARLTDTPLASCGALRLGPDIARQAADLTGKLLSAHLPQPLRSLQFIAAIENA